MIPPRPTVTRRLKRIAPLQLGKMAAGLYGTTGLLAVPNQQSASDLPLTLNI